jgi:hypothetical protein
MLVRYAEQEPEALLLDLGKDKIAEPNLRELCRVTANASQGQQLAVPELERLQSIINSRPAVGPIPNEYVLKFQDAATKYRELLRAYYEQRRLVEQCRTGLSEAAQYITRRNHEADVAMQLQRYEATLREQEIMDYADRRHGELMKTCQDAYEREKEVARMKGQADDAAVLQAQAMYLEAASQAQETKNALSEYRGAFEETKIEARTQAQRIMDEQAARVQNAAAQARHECEERLASRIDGLEEALQYQESCADNLAGLLESEKKRAARQVRLARFQRQEARSEATELAEHLAECEAKLKAFEDADSHARDNDNPLIGELTARLEAQQNKAKTLESQQAELQRAYDGAISANHNEHSEILRLRASIDTYESESAESRQAGSRGACSECATLRAALERKQSIAKSDTAMIESLKTQLKENDAANAIA